MESFFGNKFTLSIITLNNIICLLFIAFFIVFSCLCYCIIHDLKTRASVEDYIFTT